MVFFKTRDKIKDNSTDTIIDAFPAAKICKKGLQKVFNVWTKSHFSNSEVGRRTFPWSLKCLSMVLDRYKEETKKKSCFLGSV